MSRQKDYIFATYSDYINLLLIVMDKTEKLLLELVK